MELSLRFNTKWWCSQQMLGIRSYKYAKCQVCIYIYMSIRASFSPKTTRILFLNMSENEY